MDIVGHVERGDQLEQVFLRGAGREAIELALHADLFAGLAFVADVNFAARIVADEDRGEAGNDAVVLDEFDDLLGELGANLLSEFFTVEDGGGHGAEEESGVGGQGGGATILTRIGERVRR